MTIVYSTCNRIQDVLITGTNLNGFFFVVSLIKQKFWTRAAATRTTMQKAATKRRPRRKTKMQKPEKVSEILLSVRKWTATIIF